MKWNRLTQKQTLLPIFLTVLVLGYAVLIAQKKLLWGQVTYSHDALSYLTVFQLFFRSLYEGQLPLWNPYMNAGMPLWPSLETFAVGDPVAFLVYLVCFYFKINGVIAFAWCNFFWLLLFSYGAALVGNKIRPSSYWLPILMIVFVCGGTFAATGAQTGFLMPFRYFPFVIFQVIQFVERKNLKEALLLGGAIGINGCGYQNSYFLVPFVLFALFYAGFHFRELRTQWRKSFGNLVLAALIVLLFWFPSIIAYLKYRDYVVLTREIQGHGYFYPIVGVMRNLLWPLFPVDAWHGNAFITTPLLLALIYGVFRKNSLPNRPLFYSLALSALGLGALALGRNQFQGLILGQDAKFLELRNWGYCLTVFLFFVTILSFALVRKMSWEVVIILLALAETHFVLKNQGLFLPISALKAKTTLSFTPRKAEWQWFRNWMLDDESMNSPYVFEAPTLVKKPVGYIPVFPPNEIQFKGGTPITHFFRTQEYQDFLAQKLPKESYLCLLGKAKPVLDFIPNLSWSVSDYCTGYPEPSNPKIEIIAYRENKLDLKVNAAQSVSLLYRSFWDEDWVVRLDGNSVPTQKQWNLFPVISLPQGTHLVTLSYEPTLYESAFYLRSLLTFLFLLYAAFLHVPITKR
jgi:hypothetical protein